MTYLSHEVTNRIDTVKKIILIYVLLFSGALCAADESMIFFQSAHQGSLTQLSKNNFILSIKDSSEYVSYLAQQPLVKSGVITTNKFLTLWNNLKIKNNFSSNPPNASVVFVTENGRRQNFIATILNPGYIEGKLSYQISILDKKPIYTGNLRYISLIFDNIHMSPDSF